MPTATARRVSGKENSITLSQLTPREREPFFKEIRGNCCPELKDEDVQKAFETAFGAKNFLVTPFEEGRVTFSARLNLPRLNNPVLVTSRHYLQQLF